MWKCLFFKMWLSCLRFPLALHPFSFSLYIFSRGGFYKCFFVPCGFTVFVYLYICNHCSFIHLNCSKNVCAIIELINPTWACVVLFAEFMKQKSQPFIFCGLFQLEVHQFLHKTKDFVAVRLFALTVMMCFFLASYSSHLRGFIQPFGGFISIADAPNPQKHARERGQLERGRGRLSFIFGSLYLALILRLFCFLYFFLRWVNVFWQFDTQPPKMSNYSFYKFVLLFFQVWLQLSQSCHSSGASWLNFPHCLWIKVW